LKALAIFWMAGHALGLDPRVEAHGHDKMRRRHDDGIGGNIRVIKFRKGEALSGISLSMWRSRVCAAAFHAAARTG
jgi:hypothetical protein